MWSILRKGIRNDGVNIYALQNAASVASLMLATQAMVAEKPKEKNEMHPAALGMGGGMEGMM